MILLDTTVLVYSAGTDHPLRAPCRALIDAISDGRVEATTTPEVVQEFVHVRARRRGRHDAATRGRELARILGPLILPGEPELTLGLQLFEAHDALGSFDALLAASAILAGVDGLVSADRAFATVTGLRHMDPAGPEVARLIGI